MFAWLKGRESTSSAPGAPATGAPEATGGAPGAVGGAADTASGAPDGSSGAPDAGQQGQIPKPPIGIAWDAPARWVGVLGEGMRFMTYVVPGTDDSQDGDCGVYYFGPGAGGGAGANLERWASEFDDADFEHSTATVHGLAVTRARIRGTYRSHMTEDGTPSDPRPDTMLLGAIVQGPHGDVFFTLVGPTETVRRAEPEFDAMLASVHRR